jgi:hypothetical protein
MISGAPRDTGHLIEEIGIRYGRDGLTAVIGPAARHINISANPFDTTKRLSRRRKRAALAFFKAYWAEFGTKGSPERNVPPQPARPFMQPAFDRNRDQAIRDMRRAIQRALEEASRGGESLER